MMIPPFNPSGLLPPYLGGDPATISRSPYRTTISEFVGRFATDENRAEILIGFLNLRRELLSLGYQGFQWVDGSFVENKAEPGDVDVMTFHVPLGILEREHLRQNPHLFDVRKTKKIFRTDAYYFPLVAKFELVRQVVYWYSLFSHRRETFEWKGLLELELSGDGQEEAQLIDVLEQRYSVKDGQR